MKRIMVTGGSGIIRSAVCLHMLPDLGRQIPNLDMLSYAGVRDSLRELESDPGCRMLECARDFPFTVFGKQGH